MGNVSNDRVHRIRRFWENQVIVGNLHFMLGNKHPQTNTPPSHVMHKHPIERPKPGVTLSKTSPFIMCIIFFLHLLDIT